MQKIKIAILILLISISFSCSQKQSARPDEAFDSEKWFSEAAKHMDKGEYEDARTLLFEIKNRDFSKKYAPIAQLRIADSYMKEDEPERAVEEYKRFIEIYPENKYASYAQYQIAIIYFNQIEGPEKGYGVASKALEAFEKLKRVYPRNPYRDEIEVRIEKCKENIATHEFIVGRFYYKKDSYNAAIKRFQGLLKKFPEFKKEADVLYYLGMSYKKNGEKDKADEYFKFVIEKYPNSNFAPEAKKEQLSDKQ